MNPHKTERAPRHKYHPAIKRHFGAACIDAGRFTRSKLGRYQGKGSVTTSDRIGDHLETGETVVFQELVKSAQGMAESGNLGALATLLTTARLSGYSAHRISKLYAMSSFLI